MPVDSLLTFSISPLELMLRGTLMYLFLFLIFRFLVRRDPGSIGLTDFVFVVILGDAAQNAMIGDGTTVLDGMMLILTLVFWNWLLDWLSYHYPALNRFLLPRRIVLIKDGRMALRNMRRELITRDELMAKIRESGLSSVSQVKAAYLESDGELSIVEDK